MTFQNRMNLLQRTLIALSATGTAALMVVPAFAQAVPNEGVVNNGDVNRLENQNQLNNSTPANASDACAPYTSGGIGGPIDSQASSSTQIAPSSYDTARTGIDNGSSTLNSDLSVSNSSNTQTSNTQTSGSTQIAPSSYDVARTGIDRPANSNIYQSSNSTMMGSTTYNNSGMQRATVSRQFDGNNPSAAVAFRLNGPAGTAGHEAKMNLNAYQEGRIQSMAASNMNSMQASSMQPSSMQSSSTLPIACAPR